MSDYHAIFNDSFSRIMGDEVRRDRFFDLFYETFLASSDEVRDKFARTDMAVQKRMLRTSLLYMTAFASTPRPSDSLIRLARLHSKGEKDIRPELYGAWLDAIIVAAARIDPKFSNVAEIAWRVTLAPGIEFMKAHYETPGR